MTATLLGFFAAIIFTLWCQKSYKTNGSLALVHEAGTDGLPLKTTVKITPAPSKTFPLSEPKFGFRVFQSIYEVSSDWEIAAPANNLFLQRSYLTTVQENPPKNFRFNYLVFYQNEIPAGVAYCQVSPFSADTSIQNGGEKKDKFPCIARAFSYFLKNLVVGKNHNLLVCGNLLLTGEHGYFFDKKLNAAVAFNLLREALYVVQEEWEKQKVNIDGIFIKDVQEENRKSGKVLIEQKFREFTFHPNMVLTIPETWNSFEDYLQSISSKYRIRAKKAFKKASHIKRIELTENQISSLKGRLYELYQLVVNKQDFNMVTLQENYLPALKSHLGDLFRVIGYYHEEELIGYYTVILNHDELEAHFLGFQPACNHSCQVYLNMLFDMLQFAIEHKKRRIIYGRTAMEIKSSVGAKAEEMYCYIRANNRLTNKILTPLVEYLRPPDDWVPRNPFK